jgi:hypothetical protein
VQVSLPDPEGRDRAGPFTETLPGGQGVVVVRLPVADDVAVDADGHVHVVVFQTPDGTRPYSELLTYTPEGILVARTRLERVARRIAADGHVLYALRDPHLADPGIDVHGLPRRSPAERRTGVQR